MSTTEQATNNMGDKFRGLLLLKGTASFFYSNSRVKRFNSEDQKQPKGQKTLANTWEQQKGPFRSF